MHDFHACIYFLFFFLSLSATHVMCAECDGGVFDEDNVKINHSIELDEKKIGHDVSNQPSSVYKGRRRAAQPVHNT